MRLFMAIQKKYLFLLCLLISGMLLLALFGSRGLMQVYDLKEERNRVQTSNAKLQEENRKLIEQVQRLKTSKEEVEKIARGELGMVKKGEIVYQFDR